MTDAPINLDRLADFLAARAAELPDEDAELIDGLAGEVRDGLSDMTLELALRQAARWSEHPDYRPEWRP